MGPTPTIRAFVTYSRKDERAFEVICAALSEMGVDPLSDRRLKAAGEEGFTTQIQDLIRHAHVFVPIVTPASHESGWVHQEIGFAVAMRVPCVPVCVGWTPGGMIAGRQAVTGATIEQAAASLRREDLAGLARRAGKTPHPPGRVAFYPEERADLIAAEATLAADTEGVGPGCVRIRGGLGSFTLPSDPPDHPVWLARYGDRERTEHSFAKFGAERRSLEHHARSAGVRLVLDAGLDVDARYGAGAGRTRLCVLWNFLRGIADLPDERVRLVWVESHPAHLVLAVGDWFFAESLSGEPVKGVRHTVFTTHAPTVTRRVEEFDADLDSRLRGTTPREARAAFLSRLRAKIDASPRHPAWSCEP
jgi:hypothetical protein